MRYFMSSCLFGFLCATIIQSTPLPITGELGTAASADVSNSGQTFQDNQAVIKAVVSKYPEFRDGFDSVVVRAVEPSGRDFGSLLPMKDIK